MALSKDLSTQSAAGRDTKPIRRPLAPAVEKATSDEKRAALWCLRRLPDGGAPAVDWPSYAAAPRMMGPNMTSASSSTARVWTKVGDRKRSSAGTGGVGAVVVPVPRCSSVPAKVTNMLADGGSDEGPARRVGRMPATRRSAVKAADAAWRLASQPARTEARAADIGASLPRREKSSSWLSGSGSPVVGAGPAPSRKLRRDSGSVGFLAPERCVTLKHHGRLVVPASLIPPLLQT